MLFLTFVTRSRKSSTHYYAECENAKDRGVPIRWPVHVSSHPTVPPQEHQENHKGRHKFYGNMFSLILLFQRGEFRRTALHRSVCCSRTLSLMLRGCLAERPHFKCSAERHATPWLGRVRSKKPPIIDAVKIIARGEFFFVVFILAVRCPWGEVQRCDRGSDLKLGGTTEWHRPKNSAGCGTVCPFMKSHTQKLEQPPRSLKVSQKNNLKVVVHY